MGGSNEYFAALSEFVVIKENLLLLIEHFVIIIDIIRLKKSAKHNKSVKTVNIVSQTECMPLEIIAMLGRFLYLYIFISIARNMWNCTVIL